MIENENVKWEQLAIEELCEMIVSLTRGEFERPSQLRGRLSTLDNVLGSCFSDMTREERQGFIEAITADISPA